MRTSTAPERSARRPWSRPVNPDRPELDEARVCFGLHPLVIADLLEARQRPAAEAFDQHVYLAIWDVDCEGSASIDSDLVLILTDDELLLVQRGDPAELRDLDELLTRADEPPVDSPIAAAYHVLAAVVRDFVDLGAAVEDDLEGLEDEVFDSRVHEDYRKIYRLRQRIGQIDRAAKGLAESIARARDEIRRATEQHRALRPYFAHLENDARGVSELAASEHNSLDALVSSHQSNVATRQNQDMRTISAFAALLAIPTVIAGIYGMNFKALPLLRWEYGWLAVAAVMLVADVIAAYLFHRRGWLGGERARSEE